VWYTPVIPALRRLRQEDHKFEVRVSYIAGPCKRKERRKEGRREGKRGRKRERRKEREGRKERRKEQESKLLIFMVNFSFILKCYSKSH
jgi:hypothetical protein